MWDILRISFESYTQNVRFQFNQHYVLFIFYFILLIKGAHQMFICF
ncbi:hypothetical protein XBFM1_2510002 [Xenorhabdus bovienii str. feltiae Moldova]|uniref:Uncharacterized protein n=1 Tax=Xenorhabdus bovienii str. feltiae Moldova TaxID=1398200 RepID=A0A077NJ35_XENBV|nr:hypothetical protein XBFM1_2510002 [Xenorhabdus bovienii str. feltiae Moldova]